MTIYRRNQSPFLQAKAVAWEWEPPPSRQSKVSGDAPLRKKSQKKARRKKKSDRKKNKKPSKADSADFAYHKSDYVVDHLRRIFPEGFFPREGVKCLSGYRVTNDGGRPCFVGFRPSGRIDYQEMPDEDDESSPYLHEPGGLPDLSDYGTFALCLWELGQRAGFPPDARPFLSRPKEGGYWVLGDGFGQAVQLPTKRDGLRPSRRIEEICVLVEGLEFYGRKRSR